MWKNQNSQKNFSARYFHFKKTFFFQFHVTQHLYRPIYTMRIKILLNIPCLVSPNSRPKFFNTCYNKNLRQQPTRDITKAAQADSMFRVWVDIRALTFQDELKEKLDQSRRKEKLVFPPIKYSNYSSPTSRVGFNLRPL